MTDETSPEPTATAEQPESLEETTPDNLTETLPPDGDQSVPPSGLLVNDFVQARRTEEGEPVEVAEGVVVAISGSAVTMGTRVYDAADGWKFELIRRPLVFPSRLSEIVAVLHTGETVTLMGRGLVWSDVDTGERVSTDLIRSYTVPS